MPLKNRLCCIRVAISAIKAIEAALNQRRQKGRILNPVAHWLMPTNPANLLSGIPFSQGFDLGLESGFRILQKVKYGQPFILYPTSRSPERAPAVAILAAHSMITSHIRPDHGRVIARWWQQQYEGPHYQSPKSLLNTLTIETSYILLHEPLQESYSNSALIETMSLWKVVARPVRCAKREGRSRLFKGTMGSTIKRLRGFPVRVLWRSTVGFALGVLWGSMVGFPLGVLCGSIRGSHFKGTMGSKAGFSLGAPWGSIRGFPLRVLWVLESDSFWGCYGIISEGPL